MLEAVDHIHSRGVCHRDLKLENIMVDEEFDLRIIDYGLAIKFDELMDPNVIKNPSGTPNYMPPEVKRQDAV
jgi:serine/threonine protein kinase